VLASCPENVGFCYFFMPVRNALLVSIGMSLALVLFGLAPALGLSAPLCIFLAALSAPLLWALMHESIHNHLASAPPANRRLGRLLGWTLGYSWDVIRFGHLMHHRFNRHELDRPEQWKDGQSWLSAAAPYYLQLLGGHALLSAAAAPLLALAPRLALSLVPQSGEAARRMKLAAASYFLRPTRRRRIVVDLAVIFALAALALFAWRIHPLTLLAMLAARFVMLSLLDNMAHYATALDGRFAGHNMRAPLAMRWLLLNQNFHGLHHRNPALRWFELPDDFRTAGDAYSCGWLAALLAQLKGPTALATEKQAPRLARPFSSP
jgi:fatty acid desaturase